MAVVYYDKQQSDALIVLSPVEKAVYICKIHEVFLSANLADTALMHARELMSAKLYCSICHFYKSISDTQGNMAFSLCSWWQTELFLSSHQQLLSSLANKKEWVLICKLSSLHIKHALASFTLICECQDSILRNSSVSAAEKIHVYM